MRESYNKYGRIVNPNPTPYVLQTDQLADIPFKDGDKRKIKEIKNKAFKNEALGKLLTGRSKRLKHQKSLANMIKLYGATSIEVIRYKKAVGL